MRLCQHAAIMICRSWQYRIVVRPTHPGSLQRVREIADNLRVVTCLPPRATVAQRKTEWLSVEVHRACTAQRHPAAEFVPSFERIPQDPQQGSRGRHRPALASIYEKARHVGFTPLFLNTAWGSGLDGITACNVTTFWRSLQLS